MKDKLYIDDIQVDLPNGGSGIVLNRAVSKPADMSTILSGYSYTIQLPKTAHNVQTFGFSTEVNTESDFPYVEHTAKVIRDGITLFDDGVAVVKSASKTIEVLVKFGGNKRLTLLNDYKLKDIFPDSSLIPWDYSVTSNDFITWVPKLDGMQVQYAEHLRPAVKVSTLFDMIVGQSYTMNSAYRSVIEKMWLMLPTTNGSKEVADNLAFRLRGTTTSDQIASRQKYDILPDLNYQNALYHQKSYDLIYRTLPVTFIKIPLGGRYRIKGTVKANNVLTGWKFGIFSIATEFKEGEAPVFDIFEKSVNDIDEYVEFPAGNICFGIYDPFGTGNFEIDLTISFAPESEKEYSQTAFLLDYPIRENLPDMTALDFLKSVMGTMGLMVEHTNEGLNFFNVNDVILGKSGATDISKMLIDKKDDKLEYSYGLTKKNVLKYAEDDLVDKTFGSYTFTADTYDKQENIIYQSPYAATDKNIPLYTRKIEDSKVEYVLNKSTKCRLLLENGTESLKVWGKWIDADAKNVSFCSFTFEPLKYENLVRKYWGGYLGVYADKPRISFRKAKLNPTFFPELSFRKPLYADGNYYMLLSVNNYTETGRADIELALIDGVDITESGGETSLKNAILVNPTTPLKFSVAAVALYTAATVSMASLSDVTDGKMIRELDTLGSLSDTAWIAVDTGFGDAKKINLHTMQSENDDRYILKNENDTGHGFYNWEAGWMTQAPIRSAEYNVGWEVENPTGWYVSETGVAWYASMNVRGPILSNNVIGSPYYASGWTGFGSQWDLVNHRLETDFISVRKELKVYALDVFRIYGTNGDLAVSTTNKIDRVEDMGAVWRCYIDTYDGEMYMNMRFDDIVKCQTWEKKSGRYYMARVTNIDEKWFELSKTLLDGTTTPAPGDVLIRWDNLSNPDRKGLLYLSASDSYAPYMDVRYGDWNATVGTIKVRNGRLDGINDPLFPELYGAVNNFGLYTCNFYGTGELILRSTGESVSRTFEILKDSMTMGFNELREEVYVSPDNVLQNSTFLAGTTDYWEYTNVAYPLTFANNIMLANGSLFSDLVSGAQIVKDSLNSRTVLQVTNTVVRQRNINFNSRSAGKYAISFSYRPIVPFGSMTVGIEGSTMMVTVPLSDTSKWQRAEVTGDWDGTKDFVIQVTGGGIVNIVDISFADDRITNAISNLKVEYDTKLTLKADQAQMNSFRDVYDEFERVVRRDYATQTWTATKINSEVGTIVDGRLTNYSTISQTSTAINAAVRDLNLGQYATTTWTSNQIRNAVGNIDLSQYATTEWTSSQISSAVRNKADNGAWSSDLTQTANSLTATFTSEINGVKGVTEAFYKFDINRMRLNRRIELGTGSNTNFRNTAGMSPDGNDPAFWAGNMGGDPLLNSRIVLNHDGSGWLASKNIIWDTAGNIVVRGSFESNSSGNRIVIDPTERSITMTNSSNKLVSKMGFENTAGYQSSFKIESFLYSTSGSTIYRSIISPIGFQICDSSGSLYRGFNTGQFIMKSLPTIDPKYNGAIWRDGNSLKISLG